MQPSPFFIHTKQNPYYARKNFQSMENKPKSPFQDVKKFLIEPENFENKNMYRFHLKAADDDSDIVIPTPPPTSEPILDAIEEIPTPVPTPTPTPVPAIIPIVEQAAPTLARTVTSVESLPEPTPIEEKQSPVKYRLEKVLDSVSGQYKFQLKKVNVETIVSKNEPVIVTSVHTPEPTPAPEQKKNFKIDRIQDKFGTSKYSLKQLTDDESTSIPILNLYKPSDTVVQHNILTRKVVLSKFDKKIQYSFMMGDQKYVQNDFSMKNIIDNSLYLNNSHYLDYITIKCTTQSLPTVRIELTLYEMEFESNMSKKIQTIPLGEFRNNGKVFTKAIEITTPKKGCFLISILDVFCNNNESIENGNISIETNIYATNKRFSKENTVLLNGLDDNIKFK